AEGGKKCYRRRTRHKSNAARSTASKVTIGVSEELEAIGRRGGKIRRIALTSTGFDSLDLAAAIRYRGKLRRDELKCFAGAGEDFVVASGFDLAAHQFHVVVATIPGGIQRVHDVAQRKHSVAKLLPVVVAVGRSAAIAQVHHADLIDHPGQALDNRRVMAKM